MASPKLEQGLRRTRPCHQKLALAALGTLTVSMVWVAAGGASAVTAHSAPRVTVAAIDPALTAGQEVSNALYDYQAATEKIDIRKKQLHFLEKSVEFTKELMKYNANTNYTDVLTSEQNLLSAQINSIDDRLQQLQAVITLYASLGGGWR